MVFHLKGPRYIIICNYLKIKWRGRGRDTVQKTSHFSLLAECMVLLKTARDLHRWLMFSSNEASSINICPTMSNPESMNCKVYEGLPLE